MRTTADQLYPDIWQHVFEYFNAMDLFHSFLHVTTAADEVLFNRNHHFQLRGLVVDVSLQTVPEKLPLNQVVSLELHEDNRLDIFEQCSGIRSLKLIGHSKWIIYMLKKALYIKMKLEQLVLVVPGIGLLYDILALITSLFSLRRLAIYANQSEENIRPGSLSVAETKIEHLSLHSCSSFSWNELSYILSVLSNIRFLDITLFHNNNDSLCWFTFPKLRYIYLILLEVSFECVIQIVKTAPSLVKLKLNGLINAEGFVINHKWFELLGSGSSLDTIIVNLSLAEHTIFFCIDTIQTALREINLNLVSIDDNCDYYSDGRNQQRWWNLSGIIAKQCRHT